MKQLIIIIGTIILGVFIFGLIMGDGNSLKNTSKELMVNNIKQYNE